MVGLSVVRSIHRLVEIDVSSNKFLILPSGLLHLSRLQRLLASKNYLERLFDEENGGCRQLVFVSCLPWGFPSTQTTHLPAGGAFSESFAAILPLVRICDSGRSPDARPLLRPPGDGLGWGLTFGSWLHKMTGSPWKAGKQGCSHVCGRNWASQSTEGQLSCSSRLCEDGLR